MKRKTAIINVLSLKNMYMRKIYFMLFMMLFITINIKAQPDLDKAKIVQACIDMPDIQDLFPKDEGSDHIAVHIMQIPIALPTDIAVTKFGKALVFMNRQTIYSNQVKMYFLFQTLDIESTSANVRFVCYYNQTSHDKDVINVSLSLVKSVENWTIVNKEIKKY